MFISYLDKFVNFTCQDPYPENTKFKFATLCASKAVSPPLTCGGDGGGFLRRFARSCKQTVSTTPSATQEKI